MRHALVRDGIVETTCDWNPEDEWTPPEGLTPVPCGDDVGPGWLYDGETFTAPLVVVEVPESVLMHQARKALIRAGLLDTVNAAVAVAPGDQGAEIRSDWEFSPRVSRKSPFVQAMIAALGLSDDQVDALFILAASLP